MTVCFDYATSDTFGIISQPYKLRFNNRLLHHISFEYHVFVIEAIQNWVEVELVPDQKKYLKQVDLLAELLWFAFCY